MSFLNSNDTDTSTNFNSSSTKKLALDSPESKLALETMSTMARMRHLSLNESESTLKKLSNTTVSAHLSFDSQEQEDPEELIKKKHKKWQKRRQMASELEAASMREVENDDDISNDISFDSIHTNSSQDEEQQGYNVQQEPHNENKIIPTTSSSTNVTTEKNNSFDIHQHIIDDGSISYDDASQIDSIKIPTDNNLEDSQKTSTNSNENGIKNSDYYRNRREQQRIELERSQREEYFENDETNASDCYAGSNIASLPVDILRSLMSQTCGEIENMSSFENDDRSEINDGDYKPAKKSNGNYSRSGDYDDEHSVASRQMYIKNKTSQGDSTTSSRSANKENKSYGNGRYQSRGRDRTEDQSDCGSAYTNSEQSINSRRRKTKERSETTKQLNISSISTSSLQKRVEGKKSKGWPSSPPSDKTTESLPSKGSSSNNTKSIQSINSSTINATSSLNEFLDAATIEGIDLLLHSKEKISNDDKDFKIARPIPIRAFIKISDTNENSSSYSSGQPSLVWEKEFGSGIKQSLNNDNYGIISQGAISLFDIKSIRKATLMNLKQYPYAIAGSSLIISMENKSGFGGSKPDLVLEAETEATAKKLIHGLRRLIARLSYNLITGNAQVCSELLTKTNNMRTIYGDGKSVCSSSSNGERFPPFNMDRAVELMDCFTNQLMEKSILKVQRQKHNALFS